MTGLSDTDFDELSAEIFGEPAAEPSPAEPESPEAISQTEPEVTASDIPESEPDPTSAVTDPDPRLAEIERREAALLQREQEATTKRNQVIAQWQAWQDQQVEQKASEYYKQLADEYGPEIADQYQTLRTTDLQRRQAAEQRAFGAEHGLTAAMIAVESLVGPEQFQQVLALTSNLVGLPDAHQMQAAIQQERERETAANAEIRALQDELRTLRMRVEAQDRPVLADAVDRGTAGPGSGTRLEDAPDFDTFFALLTA